MTDLTPERRAENMRLREAVVGINDVFFQSRRREFQERAANDLSLYEAALAEAEREIVRLKEDLCDKTCGIKGCTLPVNHTGYCNAFQKSGQTLERNPEQRPAAR